jgi:hypothetical protein
MGIFCVLLVTLDFSVYLFRFIVVLLTKMTVSKSSLLTRSFDCSLIILSLSNITVARNVLHDQRAESTFIQSEIITTSLAATVRTAMAAVSTSTPLFLVSQPTPPPTASPEPNVRAMDKQMNMKFVIPIVVGTFLVSAAITLISIYLYCRRRRQRNTHPKHNQTGMTKLPSTPRSPFVQSPREAYAVSPLSPTNSHPYYKDARLPSMNIFGNVLVHEVGSGRRTPQEVMGDTTWGKGDLSPGVNRGSRYTPIESSDRVSRYTVATRSTGSPRR